MATTKWCVILLQLSIFGCIEIDNYPKIHVPIKINSQTLPTVPCQGVLQNYFDYLTESHPSVERSLTIQATFILENRYVAYYTGSLYYTASSDSLNGTATVSFSDRTWTPSCGSGLLFCPYQIFNYKGTDTQTIIISRSGSIKYILNSWGNGVYTDQLQCYGMNEPLYTAPTASSPSMFVMTLQEQQYTIPK